MTLLRRKPILYTYSVKVGFLTVISFCSSPCRCSAAVQASLLTVFRPQALTGFYFVLEHRTEQWAWPGLTAFNFPHSAFLPGPEGVKQQWYEGHASHPAVFFMLLHLPIKGKLNSTGMAAY